jgi:hypothetical protein
MGNKLDSQVRAWQTGEVEEITGIVPKTSIAWKQYWSQRKTELGQQITIYHGCYPYCWDDSQLFDLRWISSPIVMCVTLDLLIGY